MLAAFGTIGGALFGFDVRCVYSTSPPPEYDSIETNTSYSSMSAWIGVDTYTDYFGSPDSNLQGGVRDLKSPIFYSHADTP